MNPVHHVLCLLVGALGAASTGCSAGAFVCGENSQCDGGYCEADGYCSFDDAECESGRRYGDLAGGGVAGDCVPNGPASGSSSSTGSASMSSTSGGSSSTTTTSTGPTTQGPTSGVSSGSSGVVEGQVFVDDQWEGEFAAGTVDSVEWVEGAVRISAGQDAGSIDSRVFDAGQTVGWTTLRWGPRAPYGRGLPAPGDTESYETGTVDMASNVLLLRFDGNGFASGQTVPDSSGNGHDGVVLGGDLAGISGRFGEAVSHQGGPRVDVPLTPALIPGSSEFTWSMWWRAPAGTCVNEGPSLMGFDSPSNVDAAPSVWLACGGGGSGSVCPGGGIVAFNVAARHDGTNIRACGDAMIADGQWHHLVGVKRGESSVQAEVFVDGQLSASNSGNIGGPIVQVADTQLNIGGGGQFPGYGDFDEVAIWQRALSSDEIADLYRRGARQLSLAVRACDEPSCDGVAFVGPSGEGSVFEDVDGPEVSLTSPVGRYFQYRLELGRDVPSVDSPALDLVRITTD